MARCEDAPAWRPVVIQISIAEEDAAILRETFEAKLIDLRREESHTDSPRFREMLYQVEGALKRLLDQLPHSTPESQSPTPNSR